MLTAVHCTVFNYTEDRGIAGYSSRVWVSVDVTATANDFHCFLADQGVEYSEFLTGEYACDAAARSTPQPEFIAAVGPVTNVFANSLLPRQEVKKGDDTVCFGDSGSPLFLVRDGVVEQVISAVRSGATNWCQGSKDPYYRIDQAAAHEFVQCVIARQDDVAVACRDCSAERYFELCE